MKLAFGFATIFAGAIISVGSAYADTYLVVINSLGDNIKVNNVAVAPSASAWSALPGIIETSNGSRYSVKDMSKKCSNGAWEIQSQGPKPTNYCVSLGFGEVGCLFAFVRQPSGAAVPYIDMDKVALGNCSSNWWTQAGRDTVKELADEVRKTASSVAEVVAAKKGVAK